MGQVAAPTLTRHLFLLGIYILRPLGTDFKPLLGPSWAHLGAMLGHLGPSWGHLGPILGHLGPILGHLGLVLGHLGPSWSHLGTHWGSVRLFSETEGASLV